MGNRRYTEGRSSIATNDGEPVAKITPVVEDERASEAGRLALFASNEHSEP